MSSLTKREIEYVRSQFLGRLATIGPDGLPHVVPVGFRYDPEQDTIDIGGHDFAKRKKWRDVHANPNVAFVVDDVATLPRPLMRVIAPIFRMAYRRFGARMRARQRRGASAPRNPLWAPRGVEIRGTAEVLASGGKQVNAFFDDEMFRIHPTKVISWGVNE